MWERGKDAAWVGDEDATVVVVFQVREEGVGELRPETGLYLDGSEVVVAAFRLGLIAGGLEPPDKSLRLIFLILARGDPERKPRLLAKRFDGLSGGVEGMKSLFGGGECCWSEGSSDAFKHWLCCACLSSGWWLE